MGSDVWKRYRGKKIYCVKHCATYIQYCTLYSILYYTILLLHTLFFRFQNIMVKGDH